MSLLRVLWWFLRGSRFNTPTLPEGGPPDKSMYFSDSVCWLTWDVPDTHIQYEFSANWEEDNHDVAEHGFEMLQRICDDYVVLTKITSELRGSEKKPVRPMDRFTVRYHSFLEKAHPEVSAFAESEEILWVLSDGFNKDAYFAYTDISASDICSFDYYLFRKEAAPTSAKEAWEAVKNDHYDMWMFIADGPITFEVILNPTTVDAAAIRSVVEEVCKENDVLLVDPAENSSSEEK